MSRQPSVGGAREILDRARRDPVWWMETVLGSKVHDIQQAVSESVRDYRETAVASCHGMGKSFVAARIALWFLYTHRPSVIITTAPGDRQVKGILWKEIRVAHREARIPLGGAPPLTQQLVLAPDHFAIGFTAPDWDPDKFKGFHEENILVIADEAAAVTDEIYTGIDGVLTGMNPRLLLIGNPTEVAGRFARTIEGSGFDSNVISVNAFDTPNLAVPGITIADIKSGDWRLKIADYETPKEWRGLVDAAWVAKMYAQHGEDSWHWEALVMGQIPQSAEDTLIPRNRIRDAATATFDTDGAPLEVGIDPAGPGEAETSLVARRGQMVVGLWAWGIPDARGPIVAILNELKPAVVKIDEIGVGYGLKLHLEDLGFNVVGVNVGKKPSGLSKRATQNLAERFINQKAQHFWTLRERFIEGRIGGVTDEVLAAQLSWIKYDYDSAGRVRIEKKEVMSKRGLPSPDRAEAAMLAFAELPEHEVVMAAPRKRTRTSPWKV